MSTNYKVLCITDRSDLPETQLFIGLHKQGVDIEIMCNPTGQHYHKLGQAGITTHELVLKGRYNKNGIKFLKHHFQKHSYDIVYCFNNHAVTNLILATPGQKFKIVSYRGIVGNLSMWAPTSWLCHLNPRVKRIACVCNAVRDYIHGLRLLGLRVPTEKPLTIYKGHDISWYDNPAADLSEFGLPKDAFIVTFAGRDRPRKGLDYLIDSANHLPENLPIYYLLLGKLENNQKLKDKIANTPYKDNFIFAGFRNDAPAVFRASDTFVLPSTEREGFARAVIEAMASVTVPIVTDVGGMPEIVENGKSGFVVPRKNGKKIAEAITKLFENGALKNQMAANAQLRIQDNFHTTTTVANTKDMFEDLLKRR